MNKVAYIFLWLLSIFLIGCVAPIPTPMTSEQINPTLVVVTSTIANNETTISPMATQEISVSNTATPTRQTIPSKTPFTVLSEPDGATITIAEIGINDKTPYSTELLPGNYTISLKLEGYQNWEENIVIVDEETFEISVSLVSTPKVVGQYIPLTELGGLGAVDQLPYLTYVEWKPESETFIYAIEMGGNSSEAKDWNWWQYNPLTDENLQIDAPNSSVNSDTRAKLDLCPLDEQDWNGTTKCNYLSTLIESEVNDLIAFSPLLLEDSPYSEGELWIAKTDGSDAKKMADFMPSYAHWSSDGQWFVVGQPFAGLAGQNTHFLGTTDGSFIESLLQITGVDNFYLNGLFPEFSPNKQQLLYAGSQILESLEEDDYKMYILNMANFENQLITDRVGLFQWAEDGNGFYVLDGSLNGIQSSEPSYKASLYYIDITQFPPQEYLIASGIPYYPHSSYGAWNWAYSPTLSAIAYVGFHDKPELGVLFLESK